MFDAIIFHPYLLEQAGKIICVQQSIAKNHNKIFVQRIEETNNRSIMKFYHQRLKNNFSIPSQADLAIHEAYQILSSESYSDEIINPDTLQYAREKLHNSRELDKHKFNFEYLAFSMSYAQELISGLLKHHMFIDSFELNYEEEIIGALLLSNLFGKVTGNNILNITKAIEQNKYEYKKHFNGFDPNDYIYFLSEYVEFMLDIFLKQVEEIEANLRTSSMYKNLHNFILSYNKTAEKRIPTYTDLLLKELLIHGEIRRGDVAKIIGKKERTASNLIAQLLMTNILFSPSEKGKLYIGLKHLNV